MDLVAPLALVVAALNGVAALLGALRAWRGEPSTVFWPLLRAGQLAAALFAGFATIVSLSGHPPADGLFWLYALLPLAVGVVGEQLRLASAETVLAARGLPDAQAMRALGDDEQREIVRAILRREMAVMAATAGVVVFLAVRAATTY